MVLVQRTSRYGYICSGDRLTDEEYKQIGDIRDSIYEFSKGHFIWFLMIVYFMIVGVMLCGCAFICCKLLRDKYLNQEDEDYFFKSKEKEPEVYI